MKKYGILLRNSLNGSFQVLGVKTVDGKQVLTTEKDAQTFTIDKMRMVEEARTSKGDGSLYRPENPYDPALLQVAEIETKVIISNVTPVKVSLQDVA